MAWTIAHPKKVPIARPSVVPNTAMTIAQSNTEYQTHFLNLAHTPAKAISFLIAGEVFRSTARGIDAGTYPASERFGDFRISHAGRTSELVRDTVFAYAATTRTAPPRPESLRHVAGVGSSSVVAYEGTGAYFLDVRGYDPPAVAKKLALPLFVLQGERDYQVTMRDFDGWKSALASKKSVTLRTYPFLNHLFISGSGTPSPAEYAKEGHVDEKVVGDIAAWVKALAPAAGK